MIEGYISSHIQELKSKYGDFATEKDYHLFTLLCMKYFFFSDPESDTAFDPEKVLKCLTDGANDGGIDAIFNDPTPGANNNVIIVQSKDYTSTQLTQEIVAGELSKISETVKQLKNNKTKDYNERLVDAYKDAIGNMEDDGEIRVCVFTEYQPKNKRERNKIEKPIDKFSAFLPNVEVIYRQDIEDQIEICDNGKICVESDKISIDKKDNFLEYQDSILVNVSAHSLQELYNKRKNGLLGMNLRYYVRQKVVDDGIKQTIEEEPDNFWYKNNGIVIICDKWEIDGKEIKLNNFSIINGGQTTNRIGKLDFDQDFFMQCKIIKSKGTTEEEKGIFAHNIAKATNSQKPIRQADLKANTIEQLKLKQRLYTENVYYITKKGDKAPKQFDPNYGVITLEKVGKLSLAGVLQMPGSARSNSQRMYNEAYYYSIFDEHAKAGVIADLSKIAYYYDQFLKTAVKDKGYDETTVIPMMRNGRTFQYACIVFLCKINNNIFDYRTIANNINNIDSLKNDIKKMGAMEHLITQKSDNEMQRFFVIFSFIGEEVLGYCFGDALSKAQEQQQTLAASDYLKSDVNYYKDVLKRLWSRYNQNKELKKQIDFICGKCQE